MALVARDTRNPIAAWAVAMTPTDLITRYWRDRSRLEHLFDDDKTKNLNWPSARPVKKALAGAMLAMDAVKSPGAFVIQMVAFGDPSVQLAAYVENMVLAGFEEFSPNGERASRIWRTVPGRKWHAALKGQTSSSREVVLIHRAV
jgi:hypothetical protein